MRFGSRGFGACGAAWISCLLIAPQLASAQIALWEISGPIDSSAPLAVTSTAPDVAASALVRSPTLVPGASTNAFSAGGWPTGSLDPLRYFQFSVTPDAGVEIAFDEVEFAIQGFSGSASWELRSDADGFTAALDSGSIPDVSGGGGIVVADVSGLGTRVSGVVFRFYTYANTGFLADIRALSGTVAGGSDLHVTGVANEIWQLANTPGFGDASEFVLNAFASYGGQLYMSTGTGEIWRAPDGTTWTQSATLPGYPWLGTDFQGWLYSGNQAATASLGVWRTQDGSNWSQVVFNGFGDSDNTRIVPRTKFAGQLYAGTRRFGGGELWRAPDGTSWTQVNADGFSDPNNRWIVGGVVFDGHLYVGTENEISGGEIWRSPDGTTWTQVNTDGFGDANNRVVEPTVVFDGHLYAGTLNSATGGEVWRSSNGTSWSQANFDGFGSSAHVVARPSVALAGSLYALTTDEVPLGGRVFRSENGTDWVQINADGFGNFLNFRLVDAAVFGTGIFVSTELPGPIAGGEIWAALPEPSPALAFGVAALVVVALARGQRHGQQRSRD